MFDYHVHSTFSVDCAIPMENSCRAAVAAGVTEIAITDHVDHVPADPGYGYYRPYPSYYYPPPYAAYPPAPPPGYYGYGGGSAVAYCMRRFRSYDPRSGTYLGYDGYRHPCP